MCIGTWSCKVCMNVICWKPLGLVDSSFPSLSSYLVRHRSTYDSCTKLVHYNSSSAVMHPFETSQVTIVYHTFRFRHTKHTKPQYVVNMHYMIHMHAFSSTGRRGWATISLMSNNVILRIYVWRMYERDFISSHGAWDIGLHANKKLLLCIWQCFFC